jgi:hypothetical protein
MDPAFEDINSDDESKVTATSPQAYLVALGNFDEAVCEAVAVSQASAGRFVLSHHGWGTHIFTRLCGHAVSMIRAAPNSRWTKSDFDDWNFGAVAGHSRAIIEGYLLFRYIFETPASPDAWSSKLNVMHLNDCVRRIKFHTNLGSPKSVIQQLGQQADEIRGRLTSNAYFTGLPTQTQSRCLTGDWLMILARDEMLEKAGFDKKEFYALYDLLSNHTHILPMSFYLMEPNGRGTGIENVTDRTYIAMMLEMCAEVLSDATNWMVMAFSDVAIVRHGKKSKFSPGPRENLPAKRSGKHNGK